MTDAVRLLAALRDLELVSRRVLDGIGFGVHPSRTAGEGVEFSQFRSYQSGDDPRRVDWKLFARSGRYFVREAERDTSVAVRLAVDASESRGYEEDGVSLLAAARVVAGSIALLAGRQGDAVGLYPLSDRPDVPAVPASRDRRQAARVLAALERLRPAGALPERAVLESQLLEGRRGVTVFISDLHERADELHGAAVRLSDLGHDVTVVHLVGARERDFAYAGAATVSRPARRGVAVARAGLHRARRLLHPPRPRPAGGRGAAPLPPAPRPTRLSACRHSPSRCGCSGSRR